LREPPSEGTVLGVDDRLRGQLSPADPAAGIVGDPSLEADEHPVPGTELTAAGARPGDLDRGARVMRRLLSSKSLGLGGDGGGLAGANGALVARAGVEENARQG